MKIIDAAYHPDHSNLDILKDLEQGNSDVVVLRNFLNPDEIQDLLQVFHNYNQYYQVYDGYIGFPRPFDHIPRNPQQDYDSETKAYLQNMKHNNIGARFQAKLKTLSQSYHLQFNDTSRQITHSKTWSSMRELALGKGYFEIHCGRLFQDWNKDYFDFFSGKADIDTQFAFLIVLQRPETDCDIEIFDLTWQNCDTKINKDFLQLKTGEKLRVQNIPSEKVVLMEGDVLVFNEGDYWHLVPPFIGEKPRISFGGFMTKLKDNQNYLVWS